MRFYQASRGEDTEMQISKKTIIEKPEDGRPPQPDDITALQLAVAELAEVQAADQTANELALAELAEMIGG